MKKIFTIRDPAGQREHMWSARRIEEEIAACPGRHITMYFMKYLPKDAPILEAGCGLGAWAIYLAGRGYDVSGVDNDRHVIERLREWNPSLKVEWCDIRRLPHGNDSLGAVISLGVLEHFEEGWGDAIKEAHRVLRPAGLLFLTVPANNLFRRCFAHPLRALYLGWRGIRGDGGHFAEYRYSKAEVTRLLEQHGFEPLLTTWDDFSDKDKCLGIWTDFPPLQGKAPFEMNAVGKTAAFVMNSISRWLACAGIFCLARKT